MNLAVIGGRDFTDYKLMCEVLSHLPFHIDIIVSGGRRKDKKGADTLAENYADEFEIAKMIFPPELKIYGSPKAFFMRNTQIAYAGDCCLAFWDGYSDGSRDTMDKFLGLKKKVKYCWDSPELRNYAGNI